MKKIIFPLFIAVASLTNTSVQADPVTHYVQYICPNTNSLANFGDYIAGFGSEILSSHTTNTIYFQSRTYLNSVPDSLVNYTNSGTNYSGPTGLVTCSFSSSNPSEGGFDISYSITNGKGGMIQSRTNNTIDILFYVGLKK